MVLENRFFQVVFLSIITFSLSACNTGFGRSSNADLDRLTVTGAELDPSFSSSETEYTSDVGNSTTEVTFNARAESEDATMTLNGEPFANNQDVTVPLVAGVDNEVRIVVTAENERTKTYRIVINRSLTDSSDANLSSLKMSGLELDPVFEFSETDYVSDAGFLLGKTAVVATRSHPQASIAINGESVENAQAFEYTAIEGDNDVTVRVTAGDGSTQDYRVQFSRGILNDVASTYVKSSNPDEDDEFGAAIAIDNDTLVVGAPGEQSDSLTDENDNSTDDAGAVYVYERNGDVWENDPEYLKNPISRAQNHRFGESVAVDDDTIVVGASGVNNAGAIYVFERSGNEWDALNSDDQITTPSNSVEFGFSVSLVGDYLVVGDPGRDSGRGAVYFFEREDDDWSEGELIQADDGEAADRFGESVHLSLREDEIEFVVGAPQEDSDDEDLPTDNTASNSGAVYVFSREDEDDEWEEIYVKASNPDADDLFGTSVAIFYDRLAVGAPGEASDTENVTSSKNNNLADAGAVYLFDRDDDEWVEDNEYIKASEPDEGMNFGTSLALSAGMLAVGAPNEDSDASVLFGGNADNNGSSNSGAVFLFEYDSGGDAWSPLLYVKAQDNNGPGDLFGQSVVLDGDSLVIAAPEEDGGNDGANASPNNNEDNSGAIYAIK